MPNFAVGFLLLQVLLLLILSNAAFAQVTVRTLGGGRVAPGGPDAGFVDGNTLEISQFNAPFGAALDASGNLYIADKNNGAVRKLDVAGNRSTTLLRDLNQPVAVAVDRTNNLYVLTQGDGLLRRMDRFGNLTTNQARFTTPTAFALSSDAIYVTEAGGSVSRVVLTNELRVPIPLGVPLNRPGGIAVLESGLLAVSDTDNHRILFLTTGGNVVSQIGTGTAGFRDGPPAKAQFNQPQHLAVTPGGGLLVADRSNHRLRAIDTEGIVTTVYGVDPSTWEGPECLTCNPIILPGWFDSSAEFAEAREPVGVAVGGNGKIFVTEDFYHLIREVSGQSFPGPGSAGGGTNVAVLPPVIVPNSGYFPMGQDLTVTNPNTNAFFSTAIYYTTDGTDPTTNSSRLKLNNNVGTIQWRETTRDLTSLRVVAMMGGGSSEIVSGQAAAVSEIGITRGLDAGPGSTAIIPVTVNLRPADQLISLQFRVEVWPASGGPMIPEKFRALSVSTNDFIRVVTSSEAGGPTSFSTAAYTSGSTRGLVITFLGTNANLSVKNFAVVTMLAVPVPPTAAPDTAYNIAVFSPSGTSDGVEASVELRTMGWRQIRVAEVGYNVGDSSPGTWYNADTVEDLIVGRFPHVTFRTYGFGDYKLNNSDVNNVFAASLGVRTPYPFTDLFDAMDAYPEDTATAVGGDGLIRFLDWQIVLRRSLGLELEFAAWRRNWSAGGVRVARLNVGDAPNLPAESLSGTSATDAWQAQATVGAIPQENVQPGATVEIPVYVAVARGYSLAGLAFRAQMEPEGNAPAVAQPLEFLPAPGINTPVQGSGSAANVLLCGWPLVPSPSFNPALERSNLLGHVRFTVPFNAQRGQAYTLRFANTDGSPDLRTQYAFESRPASVWVQTAALRQLELVSDEWKLHFFGSLTDVSANADADPDQDGVSNQAEYLAGTNPTDRRSYLRLEAPRFDEAKKSVVLRWLSAPGKFYAVEVNSSLQNPNWTVLEAELPGHGAVQEWTHNNADGATRFYRLRLQQ